MRKEFHDLINFCSFEFPESYIMTLHSLAMNFYVIPSLHKVVSI